MEPHALTQADYLDILFENRNKKYGSYELRRHYAQRMQRAMAIVLGCAGLLIAYSRMNGKGAQVAITIPAVQKEIHTSDVIFDIPKPKPIKMPPSPPPAATKPTIAFTVPSITKDNILIDQPPTQDLLANNVPGVKTIAGDNTIPGDISGPAGNTKKIDPPANVTPIAVADIMPEFSSDINQYLSRHLSYPQRAREAGIEGKVIIRFVVNEDGSVSNTVVMRGIEGGCNEEALRVVNGMPRWKPGKQGGQPVKVYYTLPIRFTLQ